MLWLHQKVHNCSEVEKECALEAPAVVAEESRNRRVLVQHME